MTTRRRTRRLLTFVMAVVATVASASVSAQASPDPTAGPSQATTGPLLIGAASSGWTWFDSAVGPQQIYRNFDQGFNYSTWQETAAYTLHPNATANDYSTEVLPQRLLDPTDPINDRMRAFIATTPKNIIMTNLHEPDNAFSGRFTPAQFRASILRFAEMVRDQNAIDGGTRMTSVILMRITFAGFGTSKADDWWPTDARDGGHVDIIEGDMYARPHATKTACCPTGYTDGVNWFSAAKVIDPLRIFAQVRGTPWAIAELGYLEDIHNPQRKSNELSAAVAYARTYGAHHIEYFDSEGSRASWKLWYDFPIGTTSSTSNATVMWRTLIANN